MQDTASSPLDRLFALDFLFGIDRDCREAVSDRIDFVTLAPAEQLFDVDQVSAALFVVLEGELQLDMPCAHAHHWFRMGSRSSGQTLGDFAFLNSSRHLVRASAADGALVARLPIQAFDRIGQSDPGVRCAVYDTAAELGRRVMLAQLFLELFETLSVDRMNALLKATSVGFCRGGETIFQEGAPSDGLHFVVSGRLVLERADGEGGCERLGEFRGPDVVGEIGTLADAPRLGSLVAVRASVIAHLPRAAFESIVLTDADLVTSMARRLVRRLAPHVALIDGAQGPVPPRTFAFLPLDADFPIDTLLDDLRSMFDDDVTSLTLDAQRFETLFGVVGASSSGFDDLLDHSIGRWLDNAESRHDGLLYIGAAKGDAWTERIINRADRIVLLADAATDPEVARARLQAMRSLAEDERHLPMPELVLLHPATTERPVGTARWLALPDIARVHHVRVGEPGHIAALARRLVGRERGLVLSSGGARGYAHLGVQRFLEERDIAVDHIGGTSMGALLGAAMAMGHDHDAVAALSVRFASRRALFDYTLPLVSVMRSRKLTQFCREVCGEVRIEDLWTPFFAVSANLGDGTVVVHESGPLWQAVRSSISLPGLFSPVPTEDGRLLVDGAVLASFPVDQMRVRLGGLGELIGVDVSRVPEPMDQFTFGSEVSGWRVLLSWLSPFHARVDVPRVIETLLRSTDIKDVERNARQRAAVDVLIEPDVSRWALLDFKQFRQIGEVGYQAAQGVEWATTRST